MEAKRGASGIYNLTYEYAVPWAYDMPIWKQVERSDGSKGGEYFIFWNEHPDYWSIGDKSIFKHNNKESIYLYASKFLSIQKLNFNYILLYALRSFLLFLL